MPQRPFTPPTPSEALVQAIEQHINGWKSATFGWQDDPYPPKAQANMLAAIEAHAAECIRRICVTLADGVPTCDICKGSGCFSCGQEHPADGVPTCQKCNGTGANPDFPLANCECWPHGVTTGEGGGNG